MYFVLYCIDKQNRFAPTFVGKNKPTVTCISNFLVAASYFHHVAVAAREKFVCPSEDLVRSTISLSQCDAH